MPTWLLTLALFGWSCKSDKDGSAEGDSDSGSETDVTPPTDETLAGDDRIFECVGGHPGLLYVDSEGEMRWGAVRLRPNPSWTFVPERLTYTMVGGEASAGRTCHSDYAHEIMIWTQRRVDDTPATWSPYTIQVPADTGPGGDVDYERTEDLEGSGIVVDPGEDLFVAIQMTGQFPDYTCPRLCILDDDVFPPGTVLWVSALGEAPFNFFDLSRKYPADGFDYEVAGSYQPYE